MLYVSRHYCWGLYTSSWRWKPECAACLLLSLCTPLQQTVFHCGFETHFVSCLPPYHSVASVNWIFHFFTAIHSDILICLSSFQLLASFSLLKRAFKSATYHWDYNYTDMKNSSIYFKQTLYHDKVAVIWCFQSVLPQKRVNQIPFKVDCNL